MALYYVLLRAWVHLGNGETTVRLLSCLIGTLTVPALYAVGARLFDRPTGLVAALLLAADAGHLWASQEARSYALAMCLTTLSWWLLLRAAAVTPAVTETASATAAVPRARATTPQATLQWIAYVTTAALAVYAHFYAALVLLAQAAVALRLPLGRVASAGADSRADGARTDARIAPRVVLACTAALVALLLPLLRFLVAHAHHNIDWIGDAHRNALLTLVWPVLHPTSDLGLAAVLALVVVGPLSMAVAWRRVPIIQRWRYSLVLLWLWVPIVVAVTTSLALAPVIDERYLTICLPPLALAAAATLTRGWSRGRSLGWSHGWSIATLVALLALDAASVYWYYSRSENEDWRGATAYILDRAALGDRVLFYAPYVHIPFDLYRDRAGRMRDAPPQGPAPGQPLAAAVAAAEQSAPRVWLVLSHADSPACEDAIARDLRASFRTVERHAFTHIAVELLTDPRPGPGASPTHPAAFTVSRACPQQ